ncbi:type VI secretion system baseplate subunit TssG [Telluria aromaticivorans]|uniref:Type VI secretion system baseplate subunit TssG n=1 Tax=Telluria aromaticivorans TaxID=2725995 RepID=A0A7Y2P192_9BURK|nr:type VI secretion system baseplate subunit TssG [Telluria aromaticivorans]NNG24984.1 type VI secretion system baseplate subunit TssG [Telluria aromaticivorans]
MPATQRRFEPAVIDRLFREPYRFEYFQAVRMLELWARRRGLPCKDLVANFLRFQNSLSLGFPASQVEAIHTEPRDIDTQAAPLGAALKDGTLKYIRLTPAFMGLLGGQGILPLHYTERIAEHQSLEKDEGARAFLDTFSNRSLALFYEAWRKYRLALQYQLDGQDSFLPLLLSLAGLGDKSLRRRLAASEDGTVLDESLAYFAASIRHRPASSVQLARVLSEYFGQHVVAEQFVGCWYDVPPSQQTILGSSNAVLGVGTIAGVRVWQRDLRLRLVVGPLDRAGFNNFLPGGLAARALKSMLSMFTGLSLEYEVELVLLAADVHNIRLAGDEGRLGWDAYLVEGLQTEDRRDVRYELHSL